MNYRQFASPLPPARTLGFTSVEECEETMSRLGVNQRMRQLGRGRYRSDMVVRETGEAVLFSDRFSTSLVMSLEPPEGMVGLLFPRSVSGQFLSSGDDVGNEKLIMLPPGSSTDIVIPDLAGSEAIGIAESRFSDLLEALLPTGECALPKHAVAIEGNVAALHRLRSAVLELNSHPELDPQGEHIGNLVARTIDWMGEALATGRQCRLGGNGQRSRVAKLAQQFIEENYHGVIRIERLCRITNVGARTLQQSFREYFDLTITDYLKTVRLDAARRELIVADPSEDTITAIALRHGFAHLGRFSVLYRERFGQSPSETLTARAVS